MTCNAIGHVRLSGGLAGTLVMTAIGLWIAPVMGLPRMNPADMLAGAMGGSILLGWAGHLMIGTILALIYAVLAPRLPGAPPLRGALYGLAPWGEALRDAVHRSEQVVQ